MVMNDEPIIARRRKIDGKLVRIFPDTREEALPDPGPLPRRTEAAINAAALTDPDNPPRSPERETHLKRVPQVKVMRRALGLTQEEFAERFHIPLGTLRDWEQGKSKPDQAARAYLRGIARNPRAVAEALKPVP
jgi:putative transcriptional regulator